MAVEVCDARSLRSHGQPLLALVCSCDGVLYKLRMWVGLACFPNPDARSGAKGSVCSAACSPGMLPLSLSLILVTLMRGEQLFMGNWCIAGLSSMTKHSQRNRLPPLVGPWLVGTLRRWHPSLFAGNLSTPGCPTEDRNF